MLIKVYLISNIASIMIIAYTLPLPKYDNFDNNIFYIIYNIFNIYMICICNILTYIQYKLLLIS